MSRGGQARPLPKEQVWEPNPHLFVAHIEKAAGNRDVPKGKRDEVEKTGVQFRRFVNVTRDLNCKGQDMVGMAIRGALKGAQEGDTQPAYEIPEACMPTLMMGIMRYLFNGQASSSSSSFKCRETPGEGGSEGTKTARVDTREDRSRAPVLERVTLAGGVRLKGCCYACIQQKHHIRMFPLTWDKVDALREFSLSQAQSLNHDYHGCDSANPRRPPSGQPRCWGEGVVLVLIGSCMRVCFMY
jgi:hypothetical protein